MTPVTSIPSPSMLVPLATPSLPTISQSRTSAIADEGRMVQQGHPSEVDDYHQHALLPRNNFSPWQFSKVFFNFLYSNNSLQQTQCREGLVCPWCDLSCGGKIYSLLKHMSICHPRFHFTYTVSVGRGGGGDGEVPLTPCFMWL